MSEYERDKKYLSGFQDLTRSAVEKGDRSFFDKGTHKTMGGSDYMEKIAKLRGLKKAGKMAGKFAKTGLKSLPFIGGIMASLASGDASAAIPLLGDSEPLGSPADSLEGRFESGDLTPEEKMKILKRIEEE